MSERLVFTSRTFNLSRSDTIFRFVLGNFINDASILPVSYDTSCMSTTHQLLLYIVAGVGKKRRIKVGRPSRVMEKPKKAAPSTRTNTYYCPCAGGL